MVTTQTLSIAANFAAEYYALLVSNPSALAGVYTHQCELVREDKKYRGAAEAAKHFGEQPTNAFRVVITDITEEKRAAGTGVVAFAVVASFVYPAGQPSQQFRQTFELLASPGGYSISADSLKAITSSPIASVFGGGGFATKKPAPQPKPSAAVAPAPLRTATTAAAAKPQEEERDDVPMMPPPPSVGLAWSADTPPAFAAKPKVEVPPMPTEELPPSPAKQQPAPRTATPPKAAAPASAPAKKQPVATSKAAEAKPAAAAPVTKSPEVKAAEPDKPVETPKAAEPEPAAEAPTKVEPKKEAPAATTTSAAAAKPAADQKPAAPLTLAERLRGGKAPEAPLAPAPPAAEQETKKEEPTEPAQQPAAPEAPPKPQEATKPEPKAEAKKESKPPTPDAKPAEPGAPVEKSEPKPPVNAWSRGGLSFSGAAAASSTAPLPARPAQSAVPAALPTKAEVEAKARADKERAEREKTEKDAPKRPPAVDLSKRPGALAGVVNHFHVFVRGLPEGATEESLIKVLTPFVPVRPGIKIDSKVIRETVRPTNETVDRVRTFAFFCLDVKDDDAEKIRKHLATLQGSRISLNGSYLKFDEVHEKDAFARQPAPAPAAGRGAGTAPAGRGRN